MDGFFLPAIAKLSLAVQDLVKCSIKHLSWNAMHSCIDGTGDPVSGFYTTKKKTVSSLPDL